ncbi:MULTISPECIES: hypothetical protein [unclassified Bradyrhizobium]|jgi:hypothetical protein|uniref:hypothetical protein n=1 Tax=unclassified Bradyrhizobium TaxID=2631580 RepID=UPI001FF7E959|nr:MULTISPECIES: hypothetical protein [unclassified Bradyrhizobium]MCK1272656.1 hypothetical protein [Bradyrhizobium sp. 84]MCK1292896.1 hypothetical protein [Bradyrhizobium sp. 30]MCK1317819.1 hypothetical protein [Bradyrhizobium sp. 23]MCK1331149.1 hypothetical protein [Bradyrhizobium sp. CW9]MCK1354785.1 hypothetical protein [Bradyrhizobium sp. CW7]
MTGKGWINITGEYGLVVRRAALVERAIALDNLLKTLEVDQPLDQSDDLLSFGPHFGREALKAMSARLTELGFIYHDDFFEIVTDYPGWCRLKAQGATVRE